MVSLSNLRLGSAVCEPVNVQRSLIRQSGLHPWEKLCSAHVDACSFRTGTAFESTLVDEFDPSQLWKQFCAGRICFGRASVAVRRCACTAY